MDINHSGVFLFAKGALARDLEKSGNKRARLLRNLAEKIPKDPHPNSPKLGYLAQPSNSDLQSHTKTTPRRKRRSSGLETNKRRPRSSIENLEINVKRPARLWGREPTVHIISVS